MLALLTFLTLLSLVAPAMAQEDKAAQRENVSTASSQGQGPTDPAELEAFLDDLFAKDLEEYHVAGAAVSVVKDGELFFAKGYGYADIENKIPVDPEQTVFRIGSVGKAITWTAVMQLVEQGKLDLDADINTYLDFRIPATYPEPITLAHLMSHSAGLDEFFFGTTAPTAEEVLPLGEYLRTNLPTRVRPPGVISAYTNYGVALAGYIV